MDRAHAGGMPPPPPLPVARRGWWSRHWKWAIPVLAGTLLLLVVAAVALFMAALLGTLKASDAYRIAVETAQRDPALIEAIGAPIEPGWFFSGNIATRAGGSGEAELRIPLRGADGAAVLVVDGRRRNGRWTYATLEAQVDGGDTIDLRWLSRDIEGDGTRTNRIEASTGSNRKD